MSGNLSKETSAKFKQKLSANLSDILGCRPEAATEKIKKIMNESGLIPQGVSSKSFEVRPNGLVKVQSVEKSIYDTITKGREKESVKKEHEKEQEEKNNPSQENEKGKKKVRKITLNLPLSVEKKLSEQTPADARKYLEQEYSSQMRAQGMTDEEINHKVDTIHTVNNDGSSETNKVGDGKGLLDVMCDLAIARIFGKDKSQVMNESKEQTSTRESRESGYPVEKPFGEKEARKLPEKNKDMTVDGIINSFLGTGEITPEQDAFLKSQKINGIEDLMGMIPPGMLPPEMGKHSK